MTFISENTAETMRTWDSDREIELRYEKTMSDGTIFMCLVHSGAELHFSMQTSYDPPKDGPGKSTIVRHVRLPQAPLAGFTADETADIIREALESFKGIYGKHPDETVRVIFK